MDDIVKQAMAKWPNVPAVFGWLALDRRGNWLLKGERISNAIISDFISRNYGHDTQGRWFFQNGPQRVFVALEYTPFVYRLLWDATPEAPMRIETHTGHEVSCIEGAWIDDAGILVLQTDYGVGMMDDRDPERLLTGFCDSRGGPLSEDDIAAGIERLQAGAAAPLHFRYDAKMVAMASIAACDVATRFAFVQQPAPSAGEDAGMQEKPA